MAGDDKTSANLLLILFAVTPLLLLMATRLFFRFARPKMTDRRILSLVCGNVLVFLFLSSLAVFASEVYFRYFYDGTDSFGIGKTTQRWFDRHVKRNALGLRDNIDYRLARTPGVRRITFLGDSFTFGHGIASVEERFANHVRTLRPNLEVHTVAECGWDTGNHLEAIKFLSASGYESENVVLVYCLNDIADIVPEWQEILDRIYNGPKPGFLVANSFLFNTLAARLRTISEPEIANYYAFVRDAYASSIWNDQQQRLRDLRDEITRGGGRLFVVTFPFLHALGKDYDYADVHDRLRTFWQEQDVPHLDLLTVYEGVPGEELILSSHDVHPGKRAHEMAGRAIAAFLDEQLTAQPDP